MIGNPMGRWGRLGDLSPEERKLLFAVERRCFAFWFWWTLSCAAVGALSIYLARWIISDLGGVLGVIMGFAPLAVAQAFLLRRHVRINRWIIATLAAVVVGYYTSKVVFFFISAAGMWPDSTIDLLGIVVQAKSIVEKLLVITTMLGFAGIAQWRVLRRQVRGAVIWPFACLIGAVLGAVFDSAVMAGGIGNYMLGATVRWAIFGAITGIFLVALLRYRIERILYPQIMWN